MGAERYNGPVASEGFTVTPTGVYNYIIDPYTTTSPSTGRTATVDTVATDVLSVVVTPWSAKDVFFSLLVYLRTIPRSADR